MRFPKLAVAGFVAALAGLLLLQGTDAAGVARDRLQRHRNLGKAFYEKPTGAQLAVEEFRQALELAPKSPIDRLNYGLALLRANRLTEGIAELERVQKSDPALPHTWFSLGIQYKRQGRYPDAIRQLEGFVRLVPEEPVSQYNLGVLYQLSEKPAKALERFRLANRLNPLLVAPYFQIYNAYRLGEDEARATQALAAFQEAKSRQQEAGESEDMEWNSYAEILDIPETPPAPEEAPVALRFEDRALAGRVDAATAGLAVLDADGDGKPDLLAWSREGVRLYSGGTAPDVKGVVSIAPGDLDNDGLADLCILTEDAVSLYRNVKGDFRKVPARLPAGRFTKAVWLDYDHDYDLDLVLLGPRSALFRNQGAGGFADRTAGFPFVPGEAVDGAAFRAQSDERSMDLLVSYADRAGVLYRDQMRGVYQAEPMPALPARSRVVAAFDINRDGVADIAFAGPHGAGVILDRKTASAKAPKAASLVLADLENRGAVDLVLDGSVYRRQGGGRVAPGLVQAAADFDGDGRTDLAAVSPDGVVHLLLNRTATRN
ncbi:MAG: VCBS repeat-containing protein, partial [Acidobacteria bacterium]|nr:VCBS repeat-containing protein [Acidobacteriota bacterium]